MGTAKELTEQQQRFVNEYLIDLNATQAAIRAGYSTKTAAQTGYKLCHKSSVSDAIARAMADRSKRTGITQDRVLRELGRIAFLDPSDVLDLTPAEVLEKATEDDLKAIAGIKVKYTKQRDFGKDGDPIVVNAIEREVKMCDKLKALDMLCKHLGIYEKDRQGDDEDEGTGVVELPAIMDSPGPPGSEGGNEQQ